MGQLSSRQEQLISRMEGKECGLSSAVKLASANLDNNGVSSAVSGALKTCVPKTVSEDLLGGLILEFEACTASVPIEHLPPRTMEFVLVHMYGELLPEGPLRVTSPRGFLYIHHLLQELASDSDMLKKITLRRIAKAKSETGGDDERDEECPICMDRQIDTVLSCSHGICKVCEIEWLVGEGRGTCPLCRAREKEGDDWVLKGKDMFLSVDRAEVHARIKQNVRCLYSILTDLPTWHECQRIFQWRVNTTTGATEVEVYDGMLHWLRGELSFLNEENAAVRTKEPRLSGRCPRCTTIVRVPATCANETRLTCPGCRSLWPVDALLVT